MGNYGIQRTGIIVPAKCKSTVSGNERRARIELLRQYGVHTALYTDGSIKFPNHPDGIHTYLEDSDTAIRLIMNEGKKEIPEDLKERLLYYKSLNWLENKTGNDEGDD